MSDQTRPRIVCLSGSMRFFDQILIVAAENTAAGRIVLAPFSIVAAEDQGNAVKRMLDELHFRKIDLADEVIVVTVDGYIGESTRREIRYAEQHGKPVWYEDFGPGPGVAKIELPQPTGYPCALGVFCDECETRIVADILVSDLDDQATRFGYIRAHAIKHGWSCDKRGDFCPDCKPAEVTVNA
ncbi:hypothetical protein JOF56_011639 [Kibdelosporangium banguiense]|uniref:Uncharacterized protein n=1 Tax=Kibdelosporangium banguiense TaxID=1365924 RepID=A0ABS4U4W6_9PSEU|nr:hypothetical protein [Kibdelosporangium banguiense]MBP2331254.1 hypothetical protein [Kibdelosporangium banguiense]